MVAKVNVNDFATTQEIIEYIRKHKMLSYREEMEARQAIYRRSGIRDPKTITEQDVRRLTTPVLKFLMKDTFTIQPDESKRLIRAEIDRRKPILDSSERYCKNLDPETRTMTDEEYRKKLDDAKRAKDKDESLTQATKWLFFGIACAVCIFLGVGNIAIMIGGLVVCALLFALNLYEA